jgi:small-conductance mechanosensitive channel
MLRKSRSTNRFAADRFVCSVNRPLVRILRRTQRLAINGQQIAWLGQWRTEFGVPIFSGINPPDAISAATRQPSVFEALGDSSLNFLLRVFTVNQVQTPLKLKSDLYFSIFRTFGQHGVEIPFPQRDLHIRSVDASISLASVTASPSSPGAVH